MKRTKAKPTKFAELVEAIGDSLTPQAAKRILAIKPDKKFQARVQYLGERCNDGTLGREEYAEYAEIVRFDAMLSILQSRARRLLADSR